MLSKIVPARLPPAVFPAVYFLSSEKEKNRTGRRFISSIKAKPAFPKVTYRPNKDNVTILQDIHKVINNIKG